MNENQLIVLEWLGDLSETNLIENLCVPKVNFALNGKAHRIGYLERRNLTKL